MLDVGEERPEAVVVCVDPGCRSAAVADAVIARAPRDGPVAVGRAAPSVVEARDLDRALVALGAAAREEAVRQPVRRQLRQLEGERDRLVVREVPEAREVLE